MRLLLLEVICRVVSFRNAAYPCPAPAQLILYTANTVEEKTLSTILWKHGKADLSKGKSVRTGVESLHGLEQSREGLSSECSADKRRLTTKHPSGGQWLENRAKMRHDW